MSNESKGVPCSDWGPLENNGRRGTPVLCGSSHSRCPQPAIRPLSDCPPGRCDGYPGDRRTSSTCTRSNGVRLTPSTGRNQVVNGVCAPPAHPPAMPSSSRARPSGRVAFRAQEGRKEARTRMFPANPGVPSCAGIPRRVCNFTEPVDSLERRKLRAFYRRSGTRRQPARTSPAICAVTVSRMSVQASSSPRTR